jgi:hypothetical protein
MDCFGIGLSFFEPEKGSFAVTTLFLSLTLRTANVSHVFIFLPTIESFLPDDHARLVPACDLPKIGGFFDLQNERT